MSTNTHTAKMPVMTPAEYCHSAFAQFHNGLRVLLNIDAAEFPGPEADWPRFRDNPWRYFIATDDDTAWRLWLIIETRNKRATEAKERPASQLDPRDPDYSRQGVFQTHNCYRCKDGERPCVRGGNPRMCEFLHARND